MSVSYQLQAPPAAPPPPPNPIAITSTSILGPTIPAFLGAGLAPKFYRTYNERFVGASGVIETAREYWAYDLGKGPVTEKSPREITIDSLQDFLTRIAEGKPENTGVRSAESTLTAILGRMAAERRREVTWEEMMNS